MQFTNDLIKHIYTENGKFWTILRPCRSLRMQMLPFKSIRLKGTAKRDALLRLA